MRDFGRAANDPGTGRQMFREGDHAVPFERQHEVGQDVACQ